MDLSVISTMLAKVWTEIAARSTTIMAIVISITAFLAWLQLREISKSRKADTFMNIAQFVQRDHMRKARGTLIEASRSGKDFKDWSEDQIEAAELVCSVYDIAGTLVSKGLIEEDFVANRWPHSIIRCWKAAEPMIKEYRKMRRGDYWNNFERIYKMAKSTPYAD